MNYSLFSLFYTVSSEINWITYITFVVSVITMYASIKNLFVWKDEIKEKRKYELTKDLYFFIEKFEFFYKQNIKNNNNININKVNAEFNKFNQKLHEILLEYSYIIKSEPLSIIQFLKNLVDENSEDFYQVELDEDAIQSGFFTWETYSEPENQKDLEDKINTLKNFCKRIIKEFYLGKDKKRLKQRYSAKFYMQIMNERGKNVYIKRN